MPHVIIHFNPKLVHQRMITELKIKLQEIVADALSSSESLPPDGRSVFGKQTILTLPQEIYIRQQAAHKTDVNPAPIEIEVEAGKPKLRDPDKVAELIEDAVRRTDIIPRRFLGDGNSCVWVVLREHNAFRFIRRKRD